MDSKTPTICIGRQTGSGGKEVAAILGETLGIPVYDKELVYIASKESGLASEFFEKADEKSAKGLMGIFGLTNNILSNDKLFEIQSRVISSLAEKGPAIFIGRCADYVLRERENLLSVFISADEDFRVAKIADLQNVTSQEALSFIRQNDKRRSDYYNYYTFKKWGVAESYDLCISSSTFGVEKTVKIILDILFAN